MSAPDLFHDDHIRLHIQIAGTRHSVVVTREAIAHYLGLLTTDAPARLSKTICTGFVKHHRALVRDGAIRKIGAARDSTDTIVLGKGDL